MELKKKNILIISPQAWGKMFLTKHHYAIESAKRGNKVYFFNPPDQTKISFTHSIKVLEGETKGLFIIEHKLFFPYWLKFKALWLFHFFMRFHINSILKKIDKLDIVWSFDIDYVSPLTFFKDVFRIFHPVDEPLVRRAIDAANGANVILSVTTEILEKYHEFKIPKFFLNHGVSREFISDNDEFKYVPNNPIQIGFSGNLLRGDIDRATLLQIMKDNPQLIFNFWGSASTSDSNIGGAVDVSTEYFIKGLRQISNSRVHGVVKPRVLAHEIKKMDAFLICYDVKKDQSKGTNYHKVLEYLGTGRVVISNNISTYANMPELVTMVIQRESNNLLPELFSNTIKLLPQHNTVNLTKKRIAFARSQQYSALLDRIEAILTN